MPSVETVTGRIDAAELGLTLIHEHFFSSDEAVSVAVATRPGPRA